MTEITFTSDMTVKLIRSMASDDMVIQAAQVSAKGENNPDTVSERLIASLLKNKHGSPFEHTAFTFFGHVPIFVMREWIRHRMSSFNEMSGRYTELKPVFYVPAQDRPLINVGTSMKPEFVAADIEDFDYTVDALEASAYQGWNHYQRLLRAGIAKEIARAVLPVNIYTEFYWTVNARSLMNFLSLRSTQEGAMFPGYPQREIQMAAEQVEAIFAEKMPLTYKAFVDNGRVAP